MLQTLLNAREYYVLVS